MAVPITERIALERNEKLRYLHHEIQNCLSVISMAIDASVQSRDDDAMFVELHETMRQNRIEAAKLLDEFLKTACDECEKTGMNEPEHDEKLHKLHHDIQNCLSVISVGADTLEKFRHDDTIFAEFYQSIQEHRRKATELVDEFLKSTCDECK